MNVISDRELEQPDFVEFFENDILKECSKYGNIYSHYLPRPQKRGQTVPCAGRIFIEFDSIEAAQRVQQALSGRRYNYRCVITAFYDENLYAQRIFEDETTRSEPPAEKEGERHPYDDGDDRHDRHDGRDDFGGHYQHQQHHPSHHQQPHHHQQQQQHYQQQQQPQHEAWGDRSDAEYYR